MRILGLFTLLALSLVAGTGCDSVIGRSPNSEATSSSTKISTSATSVSQANNR